MSDTEKVLRNLETSEWAADEVLRIVRRFIKWEEWDQIDTDDDTEYLTLDAYIAGNEIRAFIDKLSRSPYEDFALIREVEIFDVDWGAIAWSRFDQAYEGPRIRRSGT